MENLIKGKSETAGNAAITGESDLFEAIRGISHSGDAHGAVVGINDNPTPTAGPGVYGKSKGTGVWGQSDTWHAVAGITDSTTGGVGVYGKGKGAGVLGEGGTWHGVAGISESTTGGAGVYGKGKPLAGLFEGDVIVTGKLTVNATDISDLLHRIQQLESRLKNTPVAGTRKTICANMDNPEETIIPEGWIKVGKTNSGDCQKQFGRDFNAFIIEKI